MTTDTNRAWRMHGQGLANLHLDELPMPEPGPGELLVRVGAVALNYQDLLRIEGALPERQPLPWTPFSDLAGTVAATGPGTARFRPGDRVMGQVIADWLDGPMPPVVHTATLGISLPGAMARYVLLRENATVAAPPSLSDLEAATLPIAGLTAWSALVETARTVPGQTVVIQGTGGVSIFALQLASTLGLRAIVVSGSAAKLARAAELGAWRGIDRLARPDWDAAVRELTGGRGADHVLEMVGGDNARRSAEAVAAEGRIAVIGILGDTSLSLPVLTVMRRQITIRGIAVGSRAAFERLVRGVEAMALKPVVDAVYPFDEVPQALAHQKRGPFGKVVVAVA
jgi:NADPH:quinone reductase-like Zn-dependent oxidoreductase